jgi:hypothetical protein
MICHQMISWALLESLPPLLKQSPLRQRFEVLDVIGAWCYVLGMANSISNNETTNT